MSSNSNHTNIHLGNYEEFFILYMDNELTPEQKEAVEQFLKVHPDLQAELELLMSTKLPAEEFTLDNKEFLLAHAMKTGTAEEELLLYIDNELEKEKAEALENQLAKDHHLQLQHQLLLKTRLDASEKVSYPNKEELYRRTERKVLPLKMWMSAAAVVLVLLFMGVLYFNNQDAQTSAGPSIAREPATPSQGTGNRTEEMANTKPTEITEEGSKELLPDQDAAKEEVMAVSLPKKSPGRKSVESPVSGPEPVYIAPPVQEEYAVMERPRSLSMEDAASVGMAMPKQIINNPIVTSSLAERNTIVNATPKLSPDPEPGEEVARKGSIKGFLRKATRIVERTTGITATNEDGELLIGAVAVKLN